MIITMPDGSTAHVSIAGPTRKIVVNGRTWLFEDHPHMGLFPVNAKGDEIRRVPKAVWEALDQWCAGGRVVDEHGKCQWVPAPSPMRGFVQIGKRDWVSVPQAERLASLMSDASADDLRARIELAKRELESSP